MVKNIIWSIVTIFVLLLITWGVVTFLGAEFIEYTFLTGLIFTAIIWFFNSSGGFGSNSARMSIQSKTGIKMEEEKRTFNPTIVFYTTIGYTIVSLITTFVYYKDYFIG